MKNTLKALLCFVLAVSMESLAFGQTFGYSITDNDQDVTGYTQQLYRIRLADGETKYLGDMVLDRNLDGVIDLSVAAVTGERVQREYEGLASIGSTLYAVPEFANLAGVGQLCNTNQDPITGLSVDLRIIKYHGPVQTTPDPVNPHPAPVPASVSTQVPGFNSVVGPQVGETCIAFGTESALGYNAIDGFLYSIASDDLIPLPNVRSQLNRIDPTTGLAVATFNITNPACAAGCTPTHGSGDPLPYLDGLTILPNGIAYGTEVRFDQDPLQGDPSDPDPNQNGGGLYRISLTGATAGQATFVKYLLPNRLGRDTGLANNSAGQLFILNERGQIYKTDGAPGSPVSLNTFLHTTGATSGATGLDGRRIAGCRGVEGADEFDQVGPGVGTCGDFEGFDAPLVNLPTLP